MKYDYNVDCSVVLVVWFFSFESIKMESRISNLMTETMHSIYHEGGSDKWKWMDLMNELENELQKKEKMKELSDKMVEIIKMKSEVKKKEAHCVSDLLQLLLDGYITQEQYVVLKEVVQS